jgi:hypothetical protein
MQPESIAPGFETTGQDQIGTHQAAAFSRRSETSVSKAALSPAETLYSLTLSLHGRRYAINQEVTLSSRAK